MGIILLVVKKTEKNFIFSFLVATMTIIEVIEGDLLESNEHYIAQQCNCVTTKPHGLSQSIAKKYPWANIYAQRCARSANTALKPSIPGTIDISTSPNGETRIIHLYAQWTSGKSGSYNRYYPETFNDTMQNRISWFRLCLEHLDQLQLHRVAMPYGIGCGLAGGDWPTYQSMLDLCKTNIVLYRKQ